MLGGRRDKRPGELKRHANRAGSTQFVAPQLVEGTLELQIDKVYNSVRLFAEQVAPHLH